MDLLNIDSYDFPIPEELIAQTPCPERSQSRLLVSKGDQILHKTFRDLPQALPEGALLIWNNTKVLHARFFGTKLATGARIEFLAVQTPEQYSATSCLVKAMARPLRRLKVGEMVALDGDLEALIREGLDDGQRKFVRLELPIGAQKFVRWLDVHGHVPLPLYIKRKHDHPDDKARYQTVYNSEPGSSAAPTAGLHFDEAIIHELKQRSISLAPITLHVGLGTFAPVSSDNISQHLMHKESFHISKNTATEIREGLRNRRPIIAVGTTSFRTLEAAAQISDRFDNNETISDRWLETDLFLYPGIAHAKIVDALITNFHTPKSSLLMLVCALFGYERMQKIYAEAVANRYRFFSYGDSSLLWME